MGSGCTSIKSVLVQDKKVKEKENLPTTNIKILLVGDNLVGKTCVVERYANDKTPEEYIPTADVKITSVVNKLNIPHQGVLAKVDLWEIPAHETVDVRRSYYADANAVIIVIDVSDEDLTSSLNSALRWQDDVERNYCKSTTLMMTSDNNVDASSHSKLMDDQNDILWKKKKLEKSSTMNLPFLLVGNKFDEKKKKVQKQPLKATEENEISVGVNNHQVEEVHITNNENGKIPELPNTDTKIEEVNSKNIENLEDSDKENLEANENVEKKKDHRIQFNDDVTLKGYDVTNLIDRFEKFSSKHGFVSGILTSATRPHGGVKEAVQSLVRRTIQQSMTSSNVKDDVIKTISLAPSSSTSDGMSNLWELYQLREIGIPEVDEVVRKGIPLVEEAEKLRANFRKSVKKFREACSVDREDGQLSNIEECIEWIKLQLVLTSNSHNNDHKIKRRHKKNKQKEEEEEKKLAIESRDQFVDIKIVVTSSNDQKNDDVILIDDSDVTKAIMTYHEQLFPSCNDVMKRGKFLEKSLKRFNEQLTSQEQQLWENSSVGTHETERGIPDNRLAFMTSSIASDKSRINGLQWQISEVCSEVAVMKARIRAAVLF